MPARFSFKVFHVNMYIMKKIFSMLSMVSLLLSSGVYAEEIGLRGNDINKLQLSKPLQNDTKSLAINNEEVIKSLLTQQQKKDIEDIELLWDSAVGNNNVIKFALKKLAIPEEQRRVHSSLMTKTLSAIISGACYLPSFTGQNSMIQSASFASARLANTLIHKNSTPKEVPLTDTEIIELAGVIESLQDSIISAYYDYKMALNQLKEARSMLVLYNQNFTNALQNGDELEILISSNLYDNVQLEEFELKENVKKHELALVRLSGEKAVKKLNLYQYNINNELVDQTLINATKSGGGL